MERKHRKRKYNADPGAYVAFKLTSNYKQPRSTRIENELLRLYPHDQSLQHSERLYEASRATKSISVIVQPQPYRY